MEINSEIKEVLKSFSIPMNDGISFLLSLYFDCKPSYIPELLEQKMNRTGIYKLDEFSKSLDWRIGLFEEQVTGFEWVIEWVNLFGSRNKDRKGTAKMAIGRMKKFFATNPEIRKDEVMNATELYLKNTDPRYITTSHYFISKGVGADKTSGLSEWIEKFRNSVQATEGRNSLSNTMQ